MAQVKVSKEEEEEAVEPGRPDHRRRPGYLGRGTQNRRYTCDEEEDEPQPRATELRERCARDGGVHQNGQPIVW